MAEEGEEKSPSLFGRDLSTIPCFRSTFLYSISAGIGMGLVCFMCTSKFRLSYHASFWTFFITTPTLWGYCRYRWSQDRFNVRQLQAAMQNQAAFEGTEVERKMLAKAKTQTN